MPGTGKFFADNGTVYKNPKTEKGDLFFAVCDMRADFLDKEDAETIARCLNAHDIMVEALDFAISGYDMMTDEEIEETKPPKVSKQILKCRAAIRAAKWGVGDVRS